MISLCSDFVHVLPMGIIEMPVIELICSSEDFKNAGDDIKILLVYDAP